MFIGAPRINAQKKHIVRIFLTNTILTNKNKIFESVESLEMGSIGSAVLPFTDKQSTIYRFSSFAVYRQAKYNISVMLLN